MKKSLLLFFLISVIYLGLKGQETFPINDVKDDRIKSYAFTNATIFVDPQQTINNGTLLIKQGKIQAVGQNINVPADFTVIDLKGKYVYPSFIDIYSNYGLPIVKRESRRRFGGPEQIESKTKGAYNGNQAIKSEYNASSEYSYNEVSAKKLRESGFGAVLSFRPDGVARGTSVFVTLGEENDNIELINPKSAAHYSFNKGTSTQDYPISAMGYIALLRQTYIDATWYKNFKNKTFVDQSLTAWNESQNLPQIFETNNWLALLRADKVGNEFGKQYIIQGSGDEYRRIKEVKNSNASLIIPLNFPEAFDIDDPLEAQKLSLEQLLHWELAPTNPAVLANNNIEFAITSYKLSGKKFKDNLLKAINYGLSESKVLAALTTIPAKLIKMGDRLGSLDAGKLANFLITSGNIFTKDVIIFDNWIQGRRYNLNVMDLPDIAGKYKLTLDGNEYDLEITGKPGKPSAKIKLTDSTDLKIKTKMVEELITLNFSFEKDSITKIPVRLSGWVTGKDLKGTGQLENGDWVSWDASYRGQLEEKQKKDKAAEKKMATVDGKVLYPFMGYGSDNITDAKNLLFKNATVWTNEKEGIVGGYDVLVKDGKIVKVGKNLQDNTAEIIDASNKHLTSGIIDEHTHIGATSINDVATNSGMVRIGDVIDPDDIDIYRQLAGGVTAAQILHGSANPIGGQSALIKFRWGHGPEALKIKGADGFIKFALGENVKRSRSSNSNRYPQTRMGIEQVYVDAFNNALTYEKKWLPYNKLTTKQKANAEMPRRDLRDETMLEIVRGKRFISCHSYVQSEINMLMHVANQFGFKVNTFTHILEGYKVADKMAMHGAGGSTFADWWAYKWEVRYAIPYNPMLMQMAGVTVAINSDDAEMARRLNQEAAKSVKYGNMSEEDAWKMVTLNPAKLLHLDDRMGSVKVGKDADLVLWSDNPLSIYAKPEKTLVDGIVYFDKEEDLKKRKSLQLEKARLIKKMKLAKTNGATTKKPFGPTKLHFHCDDLVGDHDFYFDHN